MKTWAQLTSAEFENLLEEAKRVEIPKLDRKRDPYTLANDVEKSKFVIDIAAIANTDPDSDGYIILGVDDAGVRYGITHHLDDNRLQQIVDGKLSPVPDFSYQPIEHDGFGFGVITVRPHRSKLVRCVRDFGKIKHGSVYTRKGSRNSLLAYDEIERLETERSISYAAYLFSLQNVAEGDQKREISLIPTGFRKSEYSASDLVVGQRLLVSLRNAPSRKWKDPCAKVHGIWDSDSHMMTPLSWPARFVLKQTSEIGELPKRYAPLCIPQNAETEWWEESSVQGIWGPIKEHVVAQFLRKFENMRLVVTILALGTNERGAFMHLHSIDYDEHLNLEWSYYRGLLGALAKLQRWHIGKLSGHSQEHVLAQINEKLLRTGILKKRIPARYKSAFDHRQIEAADVSVVLKTLL